MLSPDDQSVAASVRDDQQRTVLRKIRCAFQQINSGLQDRTSPPFDFHTIRQGIGGHIALVVGHRIAEDNSHSWNNSADDIGFTMALSCARLPAPITMEPAGR